MEQQCTPANLGTYLMASFKSCNNPKKLLEKLGIYHWNELQHDFVVFSCEGGGGFMAVAMIWMDANGGRVGWGRVKMRIVVID